MSDYKRPEESVMNKSKLEIRKIVKDMLINYSKIDFHMGSTFLLCESMFQILCVTDEDKECFKQYVNNCMDNAFDEYEQVVKTSY